ncbi:quinone oxidoreductase family protein [Alicyclobacillus mengziensis]|uniref:Zinc-binding dehydrogenase n=1 Tax=Alicyclobacillus mengziensis TaxID=2931921 RepID=A0A9X7W242_9BACL|nr:zinc-binding dehydrogenase [Alicyclobacillus mengziensis]QSO49348.1 zinc-binding dehydrogenase [Alicyclobacillus mengziensis]
MQAIVVDSLGDAHVLQVHNVPEPQLGPRQVLIQVLGSSVNAADVARRRGIDKVEPFIPGLDTFGEIVGMGTEVTKFSLGQRVIAFPKEGSYAEYVAADETHAFVMDPVPDVLEAIGSPLAAFTAYNVIKRLGQLVPGESVLIHGASGGVGVLAGQMAKLLGAKTVIGTTRSAAKTDQLKQLGFDVVVDTTVDNFKDVTLEVTGGEGADVVLDILGGNVLSQSIACMARFGRLVCIGTNLAGHVDVDVTHIHAECKSIIGSSFGLVRRFAPGVMQGMAKDVIPWLAHGDLRVPIAGVFRLSEAAAAHASFEQSTHVGKIILSMTEQ